MTRSKTIRRRRSAGKALIATVAALALGATPAAAAITGGAPTPTAAQAPTGSPNGAPSTAPSAGAISIASATTQPRKSFYFGFRYPRLTFTIASNQADNDLQVDVVNRAGETVRSFFRNDVAPGVPTTVRWDGAGADGKAARNGQYTFQVKAQGAPVAARRATSSTVATLSFALYGYAFPLLGQHQFGSSAGRFGAGRSGHTHQGQDVMAACGTPVVAARGGTVQFSGFHSAAGNYVVIDGRGTGDDFMYAHFAEPSPLKTGDTVRTGQPIGIVGDTGSATACHLHFEIWTAPGWYEGGGPIDPLSALLKWDRYS